MPSDFDIPRMFSYLGEQRWMAPWARSQLGGWDAFLDQMQYFGYVLPSLTALLIARRGFTLQTGFSMLLSGIMLAFLSSGRRPPHHRRHRRRRDPGVDSGATNAEGAAADDRRGGGRSAC